MWWTLTDRSRGDGQLNMSDKSHLMVKPDGSFAPALDGRDPESEGDNLAELIWHIDAAEYFPFEPRPADMWSRWNFAPGDAAEPDVVEEPSWWERAGMELPNTIVKLKDIATFDGTDGVWRLD